MSDCVDSIIIHVRLIRCFRYIKAFPNALAKLLKEAQICANIMVFAQILTEKSDGLFTLKW